MTYEQFGRIATGEIVYMGNRPLRVIGVCDRALRTWFDRVFVSRDEWPPKRRRGRVVLVADVEFEDCYGPLLEHLYTTCDVKRLSFVPRGPGEWNADDWTWVPEEATDATQ